MESPLEVDGSKSQSDRPRRFTCNFHNCLKKYTRQEHLNRHQLTHEKKQLHQCGYPGCERSFFRSDLLQRHRKRHTATAKASVVHREPQVNGFHAANHTDNTPPVQSTSQSVYNSENDSDTSMQVVEPYPTSHFGFGPLHTATKPISTHEELIRTKENTSDVIQWLFEEFSTDGLDTTFHLDSLDFDVDLPIRYSLAQCPLEDYSSDSRHTLSESRREDLLQLIGTFKAKSEAHSESVMSVDEEAPPFHSFVSTYWSHVSPQIPIIHQPTFTSNSCPVLLLAMIVALGAKALHRRTKSTEVSNSYAALADLLVLGLRWEIYAHKHAQPPAQLWVFQALLLLELYDSMYSSRHFHERAQIHHMSVLTMLRAGFTLMHNVDRENSDPPLQSNDESLMPWWRSWIEKESLSRIVYTFFNMDTLHAVMFGHPPALNIREIQLNLPLLTLPLPLDDALWRAPTPEAVQSLDVALRMYGAKPIDLLESLKKLLNKIDVNTNSFARLILHSGLLSVFSYMSRTERQLRPRKSTGEQEEKERRDSRMMSAFDHWSMSFDTALGGINAPAGTFMSSTPRAVSLGAKTTLYHMAYMIDIDLHAFQILSGGQSSTRDHAMKRTRTWRETITARLAVLHAFQFLNTTLFPEPTSATLHYQSRVDPLVYRPYVLYISTMIIWAYIYSSRTLPEAPPLPTTSIMCAVYVSEFAKLEDANELECRGGELAEGISVLLSTVSDVLADGDWELATDGAEQLKACRELFLSEGRKQGV